MPGDETLQQNHDESESEEEEEDDVETIPKVAIDPSTLTPLSPEVISKQVRMSFATIWPMSDIWFDRPRSTWVGIVPGAEQYRSDPLLPGTIGHVAHGKSTVVKAISGVMTVRFKNELVRNITIKLGYANAKVCI